MNILIFNTLYYPNHLGGAEISVQLVAEQFVKLGHSVVVISTAPKDHSDIINGVKVYYINTNNIYSVIEGNSYIMQKPLWHIIDSHNIFYTRKIANILADFSPNIAITNNLAGFSTSIWAILKKNNTKIIHILRDFYLLCPKATMFKKGSNCTSQCITCKLISGPKKYLSKNVDGIIGISNSILTKHLGSNYFPNAKTTTIHNPVKLNLPQIKTKTNNNKTTFGYLGSISEPKGVEFLLNAFSDVIQTIKNAHLLIAGNGQPEYIQLLKQKYKNNNIEFVGPVKPNDFFSKIDMLIVPSLWEEPFGRVVIEAYASGVNVIVSNIGGLPEIVMDKKYIFKSNEELKQLIVDKCFSKIDYEINFTIVENFSVQTISDKLIDFINATLSR